MVCLYKWGIEDTVWHVYLMGNMRKCMAYLYKREIWEAVWNVCTNWKSKRLYGMTVKMENIRDCMARLYKLDIGEMGNNGDCMACMYK